MKVREEEGREGEEEETHPIAVSKFEPRENLRDKSGRHQRENVCTDPIRSLKLGPQGRVKNLRRPFYYIWDATTVIFDTVY